MTYLGDYPTNHTAVVIPFGSFQATTGAPTATTNFAAADVVIYKDGGVTQRTSAAGITVTTSFDGTTGLQMIVIDLSDNTDAGFYAAGHEFQVVVGPITVDTQTLTFPAACFSIERAGGVLALIKANTVKVDVNTIKTNPVVNGGTITFPTNATVASTTNITGGTITTTTNLTNAATAGDFTATMKTSLNAATPTGLTTFQKNVASQQFHFWMFNAITGNPTPGITTTNITVEISKDGATYAAKASPTTITDVGHGEYYVTLSQGETNCNDLSIVASSTGYLQVQATTKPQH